MEYVSPRLTQLLQFYREAATFEQTEAAAMAIADEFRRLKENAVADQNFDAATEFRDLEHWWKTKWAEKK